MTASVVEASSSLAAHGAQTSLSCYASHVQRLLPLLTLAAALLVAEFSAIATPVRVRARTTIEGHVLRGPEGLLLRGRLVDDREMPVTGAPVHARIRGVEPQIVRTGTDGGFELAIALDDVETLARLHGDSLPWRLEFAGGPNFGAVARGGQIELKRTPTMTSVELNRRETTLDAGPVSIDVSVVAGTTRMARVPIHLRVDEGPELVGDTDGQGRVAFLLRPSTVGAVGRVSIHARFAGGAQFAPSQAETTLVISRTTRLTLRAGREGDTRSGRYRFSGRLVDENGPLVGKTVGIVVSAGDGARVFEQSQRSALTDARGVFLVAVEAREFLDFDGDSVEVQAVFQPALLELQPARSERAIIPVPEPPGVPMSWYFACLAAAAVLVLIAVLLHLRFWLHARRLWARRRLRRHVVGVPDGVVEPLVGPSDRVRGRRDWVVGIAVDQDSDEVLPGVEVSLSGDQALQVVADHTGRFEFGPLPAGPWELRITGVGLVPRSARLRLPHGGELDGMNVRIESVRGRVRDIFARGVEPFATGLRWGIDTPSEMERAARRRAPGLAAPLAQLRGLVEDAWFSRRPPTLEDVHAAERVEGELEVSP
jgi:hypothetical protein